MPVLTVQFMRKVAPFLKSYHNFIIEDPEHPTFELSFQSIAQLYTCDCHMLSNTIAQLLVYIMITCLTGSGTLFIEHATTSFTAISRDILCPIET